MAYDYVLSNHRWFRHLLLCPLPVKHYYFPFILHRCCSPHSVLGYNNLRTKKQTKKIVLLLTVCTWLCAAYVPAPIYFGNVIDSACLWWSKRCESSGSCLVYDIVQFRYRYIGKCVTWFSLLYLSCCHYTQIWNNLRITRQKLAQPGTWIQTSWK